MRSIQDSLLPYLAISLVYYAITLPALRSLLSTGPAQVRWLSWILLILIGPAIFGVALGIGAKFGPIRWLAVKLRLTVVHPVPSAWDWKFGQARAEWVLVILKDGKKFAGYFGSSSFSSSDQTERDIYIEKVYDLTDSGEWEDRGEGGVLIAADQVKTIEFFPIE